MKRKQLSKTQALVKLHSNKNCRQDLFFIWKEAFFFCSQRILDVGADGDVYLLWRQLINKKELGGSYHTHTLLNHWDGSEIACYLLPVLL